MGAFQYRDLIDRNGQFNGAAFVAILAANIKAETDLSICVRAARFAPNLRYCELRPWRAEQAAEIGDNLTAAEHAAIAAECERLLTEQVEALQAAHAEGARQIAAEDQAA